MAAQAYTLADLAERFALELRPADGRFREIAGMIPKGFSSLQKAGADDLAFFSNKAYRNQLRQTRALAVLLREQDAADCPVSCLVCENPYLAYARITALFDQRQPQSPGVHPTAVVDSQAVISASASVGPFAVIEAGAHIGHGAEIGAGCFVGKESRIGVGTRLAPRVTVYHHVVIGDGCLLHSGAVVGADGFGFALDGDGWCKIHQLGGVRIGHRVEIGANTCIDRGAIEDTCIEDGVIIDNHVQIAHNVKIGRNTAIAACTGIAGSAMIGANCTIAGAVGIVGHITIVDGVHITAKTLVTGSITEPGSYSGGTALQKTSSWRKNAVRFLQLDNLFDRVRVLESRIKND